ncbi:hypothetical protein TCAL_03186 [Tigriopus californicus]|uniref:DH domain-containing protein n=1 Tax=Tigriopus californicus TaxID=6832 RepID=A0A553N9Z5_TIGCA|nr:hypothetical protein TCAL_03186 [Tigriopus californicus]
MNMRNSGSQGSSTASVTPHLHQFYPGHHHQRSGSPFAYYSNPSSLRDHGSPVVGSRIANHHYYHPKPHPGYWDLPLTTHYPSPGPTNKSPKKKLVEKLGKTLDKIAGSASPNSAKSSGEQQTYSNWRNIGTSNLHYGGGVPKQPIYGTTTRPQSRLAATTSLLYPPWDQNHPTVPPQGYVDPYQYVKTSSKCSCATSSRSKNGTVRGLKLPKKRCAHCTKLRSFHNFFPRKEGVVVSSPLPNKASLTQKATGNNSPHILNNKVLGASVGHPGGVKDPYEYLRRHSYPEQLVNESEEWYSYWVEDELDEDGEEAKPLEGGKNSNELLLNPSNKSRTGGLHVKQEAEELNEKQSARKSILDVDPSVDPYLLNGVAYEEDEADDEDDEVVHHNQRDEEDAVASSGDSFDGDDDDEREDFNDDLGASEQKEVDQDQGFCHSGQGDTSTCVTSTVTPSCSDQSSAKESAAVNGTEIESGTDAPLEENPSTGKGTSSVSEKRTRSSPGGRKFHKSSHYLRRRARVQIDDVILEEDEEAIEAANIQVISDSPNLEVRSILKRQESSVSDHDVLMGNVPPNAQGHALEASEQAQPLKTGKAVHFSLHDHIIQDGEVWQSSHGRGPATQPNSLSSDDEWLDYDKVIVSHNLAEEILDEIYGKLEPIASKRPDEIRQSETLSNSHEMPVKCANEDVHVSSSSEDSSNYSGEDFQHMSEQFKKSLADEILDELYGQTTVGKSHYETVPNRSPNEETGPKSNSNPSSLLSSPDLSSSSFQRARFQSGASPRASIRSKDDLDLPDPKTVVELSYRLSQGGSLNAKKLNPELISSFLSESARLRLKSRPPLANVFSHEAPSLGEAKRIRFLSTRPKSPPPPPPPVAEVLRPVVPPKKFSSVQGSSQVVLDHDDSDDEVDCFSSDEFSDEDEFEDVPIHDAHQVHVADDVEGNLYDVAEYVESKEEPSLSASDSAISSQEASSSSGSSSSSSNPPESSSSSTTSSEDMNDQISGIGQSGNNGSSSFISPHRVLITHSASAPSWNGIIQDDMESVASSRDSQDVDSSNDEPVKPPRLKKIARLQKQHHQKQMLLADLKSHVKMKASENSAEAEVQERSTSKSRIEYTSPSRFRPSISSPVLLATTFNPNDAEAHKALSKVKFGSAQQRKSIPNTSSEHGEKRSFKELKRLSSLFASLSSLQGMSFSSLARDNGLTSSLQGLTSRSSFYVADAVYEEAECRQSSPLSDHIYEEIPDKSDLGQNLQRPLPPIPEQSSVTNAKSSAQDRRLGGSIFEGASKYEILHYLRDAKDRIGHSDFEIDLEEREDCVLDPIAGFLGKRNHTHRVSAISNSSSSSQSSVESSNASSCETLMLRGPAERLIGSTVGVERNDSGVGSEASCERKPSFESKRAFVRANYHRKCRSQDDILLLGEDGNHLDVSDENPFRCFDCDTCLETPDDGKSAMDRVSGRVCLGCTKRRCERKEIITEIYETEVKYGRDLRIILEEFYRPMLVAGLLSSDQLAGIFLNTEELIQVNSCFAGMLKTAIDTSVEQNDEDLCCVNVGRIFLEALFMLRAYESYCTRQATASNLLASLEKERELLKIFLKVSQLENSTLRRMNLSSFLMDRNTIKHAKEKIEAALEQMNKDAKDLNSSKLWRRLPLKSSSSPNKKSMSNLDLSNTDEGDNDKMQRLATEVLNWTPEDSHFPLEGCLQFFQATDANWKENIGTSKFVSLSAILAVQASEDLPEITDSKELIFPTDTSSIRNACLVLFKDKNSKPNVFRDPLPLERCIVCSEPEWEDVFEIQEFVNKEAFVFKGDDPESTKMWFKTLQFYTQCLGGWRKRRKGLGNIMVDPNYVPSTGDNPSASGGSSDS